MKNSRKDTFITTAYSIVTERGAKHLTLDELALQCHVSKGGILYYFPNKGALLSDMVAKFVDDFTEALKEKARTQGWLMAYLSVSLQGDGGLAAAGALLGATASNPALLNPLRIAHASWIAEIKTETNNSLRATELRLAIDGIWYAELFNIGALDATTRESILASLRTTATSLQAAKGETL